MKASEIRDLTNEELVIRLEDLRKEHMNLRFSKITQQLEKPHEIRNVKRSIARIHTIVTERKRKKDA